MIDKKNAMSSDTSSTNSLTGQVSGKSKVVTFTNMETASLQASNQSKVVRELLGPRSDDYKAKAKMIAKEVIKELEANGYPTKKNVHPSIEE
jgi:hypothetical protein